MATKYLVCLVLFAAASAVPIIRDDFDPDFPSYQCAKQCQGIHKKFNYQRDRTYVYSYNAEAETSVAGASEDKAKMNIQALANIEVMGDCEFALRLQDIKVYHSEPHSHNMKPAENLEEFQRVLTENTVRFSFDDGIIKDICHPSQEKIWVLNFKRGLLSAFQNSMDDLRKNQNVKEIDVTGECMAEYTYKGNWFWERSIKLSKTKDLLACYQRSGLRTLTPMVPYRVASEIQSLPIMKSIHKCDFIIKSSQILETAVCEEDHVFAPFSNHQSGGATKVKQSLTFKNIKDRVDSSQDNIEVRTNLLFKHLNGIDNVQNARQVVERKLKEICDQTKYDVRPETPRLFTEIAHAVKDMESNDLMNLYHLLKDKRLCFQNEKALKFLLDTLPIAGTKAAVDLMVTVINNDEISDMEKKVWLTSLSLIPEPSEDMLPSLEQLLGGDYGQPSLLPVSALLHTMCKKNVYCDSSYEFKRIVGKMNQNIGQSCNSENRERLMETMRAIGNVGYGKEFLQTLKTCMTSRFTSLEVKVAAADAYRRFQCQGDEENGILMEVLQSKNADSELRIMSFLSLMRCPRESVLQKIADLLKVEENTHVGTFIYTHLESLKQTSDPHKQDIAEAVKRLQLKPFGEGGFKTSRSHEYSTLIKKLNLGYVANGDLVWSEHSMVPRSMRVNLTVEMFGNSINLFEAGARMDGVDRFVQKYFGTEGYFSHNEAMPEDLEAFVYTRMFGNELFFKHLKGSREHEKIKSLLNLDKLLDKLVQDYDVKYSHSEQLMDQSMIIPTAIGLPVNMTMNSSVTVGTEAKGNIDFSGILSRSKPIKVTSNIAASASVEVTGSMMVDSILYKQGVRMRNTLHSSVNLNAELGIKNRQVVNFEINSPEEKQEIFDARSQFFIVHDNFEEVQKMITENRREVHGCTGKIFTKATGVELCGTLEYPNATLVEDAPYFPLTGPVRASLVMNKKDTQRSYKIFAKWVKHSEKLVAQLQLDTPGSKVDRHISADVTVHSHVDPHVDIVFISPWKRIILNGKAAMNKEIVSLTGKLDVDSTTQYSLTSEVKIRENHLGFEYTPFVEVENGKQRFTLLQGTVVHTNKILANLEVQDFYKKLYKVKSELINNSEGKVIDVSAGRKGDKPYRFRIGSTHKLSGGNSQNSMMNPGILIQGPKGEVISLQAYGEYQPKPLNLLGNMTFYTSVIKMAKPVSLKVEVTQKKRNSFPVKVVLKSSLVNVNLNGKVVSGKKSHTMNMKGVYKIDTKKDKIAFVGKLIDKSSTHYSQYKMKSTLKFEKMSQYNTVSTLEIVHKKKCTAKLTIQFTENQKTKKGKQSDIEVTASLNTDLKILTEAGIQADLKAKMPEEDIDIKMKLNHRHSPKKLSTEMKLRFAPFVEQDINAKIQIQDKGSSLFDIIALGNLEARGKKYNLKSELIQKSKRRLEHSIVITDDQQEEHSLVTVYTKTNERREINSEIKSSHVGDPLVLHVSADWNKPTNFHIRGVITENNSELYYAEALSKLEGDEAGKWNLELAHPTRKVKAKVDFTNINNRIKADALLNWDVKSHAIPAPEVHVISQFTRISKSDSILLKGNVEINTPFKDLENVNSNLNFEMSESDLKSTGKITFDRNRKEITSMLSAKLPISLDDAEISFKVQTPFNKFTDIDVELKHKMDSKIKTYLKAQVENDKSEVMIKGSKDITDKSRTIEAQVTVKTPYQSFRRIVINFDHSDDDKEIRTTAKINRDGKKYNFDLHVREDSQRPKVDSRGQLKISGPVRWLRATWTNKVRNGQTQIEASMKSAQNGENEKINVQVKGYYRDLLHHNLDVDVETPMQEAKKIGLHFGNEIGGKQLKSRIVFEINHPKAGYDITLKNKQRDKSVDVTLYTTPFLVSEHPLLFKSSLKFDKYPFIVSGQMGWAPSSVIGFTGSCMAQSMDNMDIKLNVLTPLRDLENFKLQASNVLKNRIRVSRLTFDLDKKTILDAEIKTQNSNARKSFRLQLLLPLTQFQSLDTGVSFDQRKGVSSKANFELLLTPEEKYEGQMSVKIDDIHNMNGKITIKTPVEGLKHLQSSFIRGGSKNNRQTYMTVTNGDNKLVDVKGETEVKNDEVNIKITTQGKLLPHILEVVDGLSIWPRLHKDREGNKIQKIITKVTVKEKEPTVQVDGSVVADFGQNQQESSTTIRISGQSVNDADIYVSLSHNGNKATGKLVFKLADGVQIQATLIDMFGDKHGIEFSQSGDKSEYKGTLYMHELRGFESSIELFVSNIQRIEFISTTKTTVKGYEILKVKYTHDGQDNRISNSFSVEDKKGIKASIELVCQSSPIHRFSLKMKTPFQGYRNMIISGYNDETTINGLFKMNEITHLSLVGAHDNLKNPDITIETSLQQLQHLSVHVDGEFLDGSTSFTLKFNDNDQVDGKVLVKYDIPSKVEISAQLKANIDQSEKNVKFEMETTERPKRTHILIAVNDVNQIKYDSKTTENDKTSIALEIRYPDISSKTNGVLLKMKGNEQKYTGKIQVLGQSEKVVDADVNIDNTNEMKASLTVHQPKRMEYKFTRENFQESNENELYFNWDRNDPGSNLAIKAILKDETTSYAKDKSVSLRVSCPKRSVGLEHSVSTKGKNIKCHGKIYWNDDKDSQLSYDLKLKDQSNRRQTTYDGDLKVTLPTRTVGLVGHISDENGEHHAQTTFSWDVDNDSSKRVGLKAKLQNGEYTQADVSLILPKDAHVDSKVVMNKGNTIVEGETQIVYSQDPSKTLTLFSKLENNPGHRSFFFSSEDKYNYSIQLGISHPDSQVDVKMVSHLGSDSSRLTTSMGIDYLTSREQNKNMDLFMEINKLKKEIKLHAVTPYRNIGLAGGISQNPLELKATTTVNNQNAMSARLLVDQAEKKIQFDYTNDVNDIHYSATIPNQTSVLLQGVRREHGQEKRDINILIQLTTPDLLKTDLQWKPGMLKDLRDTIFNGVKRTVNDVKSISEEVASDVKTEVFAKYTRISKSLIDDIKHFIISIEQEIAAIENDLDQIKMNLGQDFDFCKVEIGDFDLNEEIASLQQKLQKVVKNLQKVVKSYTKINRETLRNWSGALEVQQGIPADEVYETVLNTIGKMEHKLFKTFNWDILRILHDIKPEVLDQLWNILHEVVEKRIDPQAIIDDLNEAMVEIKNTKVTSLIASASQKHLQITSRLKIIIKNLSQFISDHPYTQHLVDFIEEHSSELYQMVRWSINYLEIEKNIPKHLGTLIDHVNELAEEELKEQMGPTYRYIQNPITKFDPQQGVLHAQLPLIVSIDRLDKMPSVLEMSKKVANYVENKFGTNNSDTQITVLPIDENDPRRYTRAPSIGIVDF